MKHLSAKSKVLLVDDSPTALVFMAGCLRRRGYDVCTEESAADAEKALRMHGLDNFGCVVTDLWMPGGNGLDLLRSIQDQDPNLATVVVTAAGEREMVARSLRAGACDFLEKPISATVLEEVVERGITVTRKRRQLAATASSARLVGQLQHLMLNQASPATCPIEIRSFPKEEAGGDSVSFFQLDEEHYVILMTDVSGHDLYAAYVSAYFQGLVRGMLQQRVPVPEVFAHFNHILLHEWARPQMGLLPSVSACSLVLNTRHREATILTSGAPSPLLVTSEGRMQVCGGEHSMPLGWFAEEPHVPMRVSYQPGDSFFVWTDGLESLAQEREVGATALGTHLLLATAPQRPTDATDDLLIARIGAHAQILPAPIYYPIWFEDLAGDEAHTIDSRQEWWKRNLLCAFPSLPEEDLYAVLLACREAVLNAQVHGCRRDPQLSVHFSMAYAPSTCQLRVFVSDPGPGHDFQPPLVSPGSEGELPAGQRGLLLISELTTALQLARRGAELRMDFQLHHQPTS